MTSPVLEAHGLHRFYRRGDDEVAALLDVSLEFEPGEFVAVRGPSGSGKSTLLTLLAGLDDPDGGGVRVAGHRLSHQRSGVRADLRRRYIGILTQHPGLVGHLSVQGNVALAWQLRRTTVDADLIEAVGLAHRGRALPRDLSGGETARAGLAVALAGNPLVLLADEPTAEVSLADEASLLDLLRRLRPEAGVTVLVTHSAAVAAVADRIVDLDAGHLQ